MGVQDRDYVRSDPVGRGLGGFLGSASALTWIIGVNVAVFLAWQVAGPRAEVMADHFTVSAQGVLGHLRLHTVVTSAFSHFAVWHLILNMLFLWWLGSDLEERIYGSRDFVALYLFGGVAASVAHVALSVSRGIDAPALGASGAVMGVMVVAAFLFPDRPIGLFYGLVTLPLKVLVPIYVLVDLAPVLRGEVDGVAHAAHLGGAAAGFLFYRFDLRFFRAKRAAGGSAAPLAPAGRLAVVVSAIFSKRRTPESSGTARPTVPLDDRLGPPASAVDAETAASVDRLLAKVSQGGLDSLTAEERRFLNEASERYKRR